MTKSKKAYLIDNYHLLSYDEVDSTNSEARRLAEAALRVPPGAAYYRLAVAERQVGFASSTIDTTSTSIRVTEVLVLQVPARAGTRRFVAQQHALGWLRSDDRDWLYAFRRVCETLGLDANRVGLAFLFVATALTIASGYRYFADYFRGLADAGR